MRTKTRLHALAATALCACACAAQPQPAQDRLRIEGLQDGSPVYVMIDGRIANGRAGCANDYVLRSRQPDVPLGANLLPAAGCNSEVVVFSQGNAMFVQETVDTWTDGTGDVHSVTLQPIIVVPVSVWIADPKAGVRAREEMANANLLYAKNHVGVRFAPTFREITDAGVLRAIEGGLIQTAGGGHECVLSSVRDPQAAVYTPNTLNVYYVRAATTGRNCAFTRTPTGDNCELDVIAGDGNVTYIGSRGNLGTLPHELAHAFGLRPAGCGGHVNDAWGDPIAGYSDNNIMMGEGSSLRDHFTLGQVYRMNMHVDRWGGSMLIANGLRTGPTRECAPHPEAISNCPALTADWPQRSFRTTFRPYDMKRRRRLLDARYDELVEQSKRFPQFQIISTKTGFVDRYAD